MLAPRRFALGSVLFCILLLGTAASARPAQRGAAAGEWPVYGGDLASTGYAPLDQINATNVADLRVAWSWTAQNFGPRAERRNETTPLMVDGVLYATAGSRRSVVAIDPGSGETLWMYRLDEGERGAAAPRPNSGRGVAYWSPAGGDEMARVFVVTPGFHMVALDARSGRPVSEFGEDTQTKGASASRKKKHWDTDEHR